MADQHKAHAIYIHTARILAIHPHALVEKVFFRHANGIYLGDNVRVQRLRCLSAEKPSAAIYIHENSVVYENAMIEAYGIGKISIGSDSVIGDARIYSREEIEIGQRVITSWNVFIQDFDPHPIETNLRALQMKHMTADFRPYFGKKPVKNFDKLDWQFPTSKIVIGDDVWIGANTTILKGARIGNGSVIATGAVVVAGDYPAGSILGGVSRKNRLEGERMKSLLKFFVKLALSPLPTPQHPTLSSPGLHLFWRRGWLRGWCVRPMIYFRAFCGTGPRVIFGKRFAIQGKTEFFGEGTIIIGDDVIFDSFCTPFTHSKDAVIRIGDRTYLNGTRFGCSKSITIGTDCILADARIMDTDFHAIHKKRNSPEARPEEAPIVIGNNVWVAAGSAILKGVNIGDDSVVAFGTVVTKDVPSGRIVGGNPMKDIAAVPEGPDTITLKI